MAIFDQLSCCWSSLVSVITRNHKYHCHDYHIKTRNMLRKLSASKFGSIFGSNLDMWITIVDYQKSQKWLS